MLPEYKLALKNLSFNLHNDVNFQEETGRTSSIEFSNNELSIYDVYNFDDRMDIEPHGYTGGSRNDAWFAAMGGPSSLDGTVPTDFFIGGKNLQRHKESVIKAMLVALLTNNGKRSSTLNSDSVSDRRITFFNSLFNSEVRDPTIKPWSTWRDTHTTLTNSGITATKTNGLVTVNTNTPHGLDAQYDDWGIVIETGNSNFDMPSATYPNGVPIKIVNSNSFTYRKSGSDTPATSISGTFDVKIGWGGSSNNLHLYFT
jgi:hypothetical protein